MTITVKAFANADDVLIAWQPNPWPNEWVGFQLERRDDKTQQVTVVPNRIPPKPGQGPVQPAGISSAQSPIRRCIWTDHSVVATDDLSYRVTAIKAAANGAFAPDPASASAWTAPMIASGDAGNGLSAYFNRGTLMSQIVSRFVQGNVTDASLRQFLTNLETPGFQARRYLSGDALVEMLGFLHDADRRGSAVHAAIYEMNDHELVDGLKPFGTRGHVLLGNGSATKPWVAQELTTAGLEVKHRDLSHAGKSSPSVHNKFVVESDPAGAKGTRVLTGSTNWTTSGLCTQLNNVLIVEDPTIASRFLDQWSKLVAAGDDMPPSLKQTNSTPTNSNNISLFFAATNNEAEFKPVLDLIAGAQDGALFLMFMPGQSPLLNALLTRVQKNDLYVRGVVSTVNPPTKPGDIGQVGGQVVKSGAPSQEFHDDVLLPVGVNVTDKPSWAEQEFTVKEIHDAHLMAIVHSKTIVIDPFSDNCAVITGSHNFSDSASGKNDENLVIIRGNKELAQAYAVHVYDVYDHYRFRAWQAQNAVGHKPEFEGHIDLDDAWLKNYVSGAKGDIASYLLGSPLATETSRPTKARAAGAAKSRSKSRRAHSAAKPASKTRKMAVRPAATRGRKTHGRSR